MSADAPQTDLHLGPLIETVVWRSEGGYVATAEQAGQYLLIVDESMLAELLGESLDADLEGKLRRVTAFATDAARARRIEELRP